jgi:RNA polymerase sigma-70 factor (ECF subfamily)
MVSAGILANRGMVLRDAREPVSPALRPGLPGEAAIIARAIADPQAFAPIYEFYVDLIFGYCQRRVSDPEFAADLTSQIFIKALTALPNFQSQPKATSFRSWLFTIAHNLVIDAHRTRRPHHPIDGHDGDERPMLVVDPAPLPEDQALTADLRTALVDAMRHLTGQQRQIVDLRLAGLTGPEIASVLGLHIAAVKSLQFRAYAKLRTLLRDRFESEFGEGRTS